MSDSLYVNDNGTPVPLNLGTGIEFVERIEALEQEVSTQATKDAEQDTAITAAQSAADNAASAASAAQATVNGAATAAANAQTTADNAVSAASALASGSGFNAAGKAEIVGWGMPDYSAGVSFTSGFTAPSAGLVFLAAKRLNGSSHYGYCNEQLFFRNLQAGSNVDASSATTLVGKGDVVTFSSNIDVSIFYPLKGA